MDCEKTHTPAAMAFSLPSVIGVFFALTSNLVTLASGWIGSRGPTLAKVEGRASFRKAVMNI
jgi:hypothetical protein